MKTSTKNRSLGLFIAKRSSKQTWPPYSDTFGYADNQINSVLGVEPAKVYTLMAYKPPEAPLPNGTVSCAIFIRQRSERGTYDPKVGPAGTGPDPTLAFRI